MKAQIHKRFYCKVCKMKTMFVEHAEKKGFFICQQCRYSTSDPIEESPVNKRKYFTYV